jgi:hypothetical protein
MRKLPLYFVVLLIIACSPPSGQKPDRDMELLFTIFQERDIYEKSDYGEPPQFAIWLENRNTGEIKSVFVTYRTATGDFEGKAECPVSLPVWIRAFRKETGRTNFPTIGAPAPEAVTGATPKVREFTARVTLPGGSAWAYYVEVNVSGDYTPEFPALKSDGTLDPQGNGQPSIVYRGEITCAAGNHSIPELIGRTEQNYFSAKINPDLNGIESAKKVFSRISVKCVDEDHFSH